MARALLALVLALAAVPAHGAVMLYTDEAAYLAAVGATRAYVDFAGSPGASVSGDSFHADVTFGSCTDSGDPLSCGSLVLHSSDAITDRGGVASNNVGSLAWVFQPVDVYAFAFNYISGDIASVTLLDSLLSPVSIDTSAANGFIGLVSITPFFAGIGVNGVFPGVGYDRYFIDDFRINDVVVPEPATLALFGLALSVLGYRLRRSAAAAKARG